MRYGAGLWTIGDGKRRTADLSGLSLRQHLNQNHYHRHRRHLSAHTASSLLHFCSCMLYRRNKSAQKESTSDLYLPSNHYIPQDGSSHSDDAVPSGLRLLLDVPEESLLHITSYLEPPSLLALGRVCKILSQHVKLDSTWLRAFATQCLAISPESDLELIENKSLMLRRSPQQPWRDLFIARYKLLRYADGMGTGIPLISSSLDVGGFPATR